MVMPMNLVDSKAREEALNIANSYIVQAPAGSGKTHLLVSRYLKLLRHADQIDQVVALTFTRKAANEMLHRVFEEITLHHPENQWHHLTLQWQNRG